MIAKDRGIYKLPEENIEKVITEIKWQHRGSREFQASKPKPKKS